MKKLSFIPVLIAILTIFTISCKKDDDDSIPATRIKYIISNTNDTTKLTYDNQNRISTEQINSNNLITWYQYKGSDSIIIYQVDRSTQDTTRNGYYKLNANGVATQYFFAFATTNYVYNTDNFKIYETVSSGFGSSSDSLNVSGGNVTSSVSKSGSFTGNTRTVNSFTLDTRTNTITNAASGKSFLGKSNANLVTALHAVTVNTSTICIPTCSVTTSEKNYTYAYEFDTNNRVTRVIQTDLSTSSTLSTRYVYY